LLALLADNPDLRYANSFVNTCDRQAPVIRTLAATSKACSYASPPKEKSQVQSPRSNVFLTLDFGL
jgi:hypothetical protein